MYLVAATRLSAARPTRATRHFSGASAAAPVAGSVAPSPYPPRPVLSAEERELMSAERVSDQVDALIIGGGPSGLAAAIRLKQLAAKHKHDIRVCLVEKGAEIGAHIISGAVIEPRSLTELIPDWKERGAPLNTPVTEDEMWFLLDDKRGEQVPFTLPYLNNHGNYIVSLSNLCKWLGAQAEELGVEIYPGCAATEVLYNENGSVKGIATGDVGVSKSGKPKDSYERGMELHAKLTLFAEGTRGSLTKTLWDRYNLRENVAPQTFGLGVKEVWEVDPAKHKPGLVSHAIGWPLNMKKEYGGSFMYHFDDNKVAIGYVLALDYENPSMSPYREFQRFKHHPTVSHYLEGGKCIAYGARAVTEGGLQALPKLIFPGGALIGDTAGFLNVPKIKGTHTAMKSGILAAESAFEALKDAKEGDTILLEDYPAKLKESWLWKELFTVRNIRGYFRKFGFLTGLFMTAIDLGIFRGKVPWTIRMEEKDNESLKPASSMPKIMYPTPDNKISFDLLTNLSRSGTNHAEDQPCHLTLKDKEIPVAVNLAKYGGPEAYYCPAGVYEYIEGENGEPKLQINSQNCVHCKTCDIKDPTQNINWVPPQGGGGPLYQST